jgi:two-component system cell cycle sensor histidine kinase/response regulator CckA
MPSHERCVVLVADDEPMILRLTSRILMSHGYTVIPATDGKDALEACHHREGPIHLAILDVMMPGMTGPDLAKCLKEHDSKIEVLFMSGYESNQIAKLSPGIQNAHFIAKPFLPKEILQKANAILGNMDVCEIDDEAVDDKV